MRTRTYTTVSGFFVQDNVGIEPVTGEIPPRFGLVDQRDNRWSTFVSKIEQLNANAKLGTQIKVFFLGRHGEGFHNVAEKKYGDKEWRERWAAQEGDGKLVWGPDPNLTSLGEQQAEGACEVWKNELSFRIPLPKKLYTSPLTRAIQTNQLTFDKILLTSDVKRIIVENIREHNGMHTCDKRRKRSELHDVFPKFEFEEGFTEEDQLWKQDYRETHEDIDRRAKHVLDMIFDNDTEQFVSITTHGGFIGGFLRVCQHRPWTLPTGGVIPVVVQGSVAEEQLHN